MHTDTFPERINKLVKPNQFAFKVKSSEFIALAFPLKNKNDLNEIIEEVRKKYYDATHHCYAYKLLDGSNKNSDDGEPKGTAGIRIQNAIEHFNLSDILIMVVRYFGGTKLGVGPLGKAYQKAAFEVLEKSEIKSFELFYEVEIHANFENISLVHHIISLYNGIIVKTEYSELVNFICLVKKKDTINFRKELQDKSNGQINSLLTTNFTYS